MKRQIKLADSPIVINNWRYTTESHKTHIRKQLKAEQGNFCAYSELYLPDYDQSGKNELSPEIEHFNPTLKNTDQDGYENWFLVIRTLNQAKSDNWIEPILYPTAKDFEERVIYQKETSIYVGKDQAAQNLIDILGINVEWLRKKRVKYLKSRQSGIDFFKQTPEAYFKDLMQEIEPEPVKLYFIRAIETEFSIKINFQHPQ